MAVITTTRYNNLDEFRQNTNELSSFVGDQDLSSTITATTLTDAVNEHESDIGNMVFTGLTSTNISAALREIRVDIGDLGTNGANLTTSAKNLTSAIIEHESDIGSMVFTGLSATNISAAIRELRTKLGDITTLTTTAKSNTVAAINELNADKVELTSATSQLLNSDFELPAGKNFVVKGTMDIRTGQLLVPAGTGTLKVSTSFIQLGDETSPRSSGGLYLTAGTSPTTINPGLQWDETIKQWNVIEWDSVASAPVTSQLLSRFNAEALFANNTESGINVTWDNVNQNFDVAVKANGVTLGTHTVGNYVATIAGTTDQITVTGSGIETAGVTISLPDNVKITSNLEVGGNTIVNGNLTVKGSMTTTSSSEVSYGDSTIRLNSDYVGATPTEDAGLIVNRGGTVSNVQILWNEAADRWQFTDTTGTYNIWRTDDTLFSLVDGDGTTIQIDGNDKLTFVEGVGIDMNFTSVAEPNFAMTVTNTDRGSTQNIFKNITVENTLGTAYGTLVADTNNDTFYVREGAGITMSADATNDRFVVGHADTSTVANFTSNNSGNTFIQDLTLNFDEFGHVTSVGTVTATVNQTNFNMVDNDNVSVTIADNKVFKIAEGYGMNVAWTDTLTGSAAAPYIMTISHADLSEQGSVTNANSAVIQSIGLDSSGHITSLESVDLNPIFVNVNGDKMTNLLHIESTGNETLRLTSINGVDETTQNPFMSFYQGSTRRAYLQWVDNSTNPYFQIRNDETANILRIFGGINGLKWVDAGTSYDVRHTGLSRTYALTGDVAGSVTVNDGTNVSISTTIQPNSVALGTDTTGDYIATLAPTTSAADAGITVTSGTGESAAATIKVNSDLRGVAWLIGRDTTDYINVATTVVDTYLDSLLVARQYNTGDLHIDGRLIANSSTTTSDIKLKENIVPVKDAINKIKQINGVEFNWIKSGIKSAGVIAQEVENVLPQAVSETEGLNGEESYKTVDYNTIHALLIEAIKDQQKIIESMQIQIDELKSRVG
jgi:hypothetical protein